MTRGGSFTRPSHSEWVRPLRGAESLDRDPVGLALRGRDGLHLGDQRDAPIALISDRLEQFFGSSHLARVRACCGLLCAVCEVFEVQVLVVVGSAVRRLRGGSFVCASGVLAVDVAADCDTIAGPQRSFVTPRPGVVPAWATQPTAG